MTQTRLDPNIALLFASISENKVDYSSAYQVVSSENALIIHSADELKELGISSLRNNCDFEMVSLPGGMDVLPESFFYGCNRLKYVQLPDDMTRIERFAFFGCSAMEKLRLPRGTVFIGEYAFSECTELAAVDIPYSVSEIGCAVFRGCTALREVRFPVSSRLERIGSHCFQGCEMLKTVSLPDRLEYLPESIISGCCKILEFRVPRGVKEIAKNAFFGSTLDNVYFLSDDILLHKGSLNGLEHTNIYVNANRVEFRNIEQDMKSGEL